MTKRTQRGKLSHNTDMAYNFLSGIHGDRPIHLVGIGDGRSPITKTFDKGDPAEIMDWMAEQNARQRNLYWHVNELRPGVENRKAKKGDIARVHMLHVDVDDQSPFVLEKLKAFTPRPTAIIFSGGGYQAFWLLDQPTEDLAKAEAMNKWLADQLGGDHCQNVDRIMRVPGTINWPNAKKKEAGRTPVMAYVL